MTARRVIAVPAKGRVQENAENFFARAGLALVKPRGARDYRGAIAGLDEVEVAYLSAAEIAGQLAQGAVHLGVTGEDLVREMIPKADDKVNAARDVALDGPWQLARPHKHVVERVRLRIGVDSEHRRRISLGICVDNEDARVSLPRGRSHVDRDCAFSRAALLVGHRDRSCGPGLARHIG